MTNSLKDTHEYMEQLYHWHVYVVCTLRQCIFQNRIDYVYLWKYWNLSNVTKTIKNSQNVCTNQAVASLHRRNKGVQSNCSVIFKYLMRCLNEFSNCSSYNWYFKNNIFLQFFVYICAILFMNVHYISYHNQCYHAIINSD